MKPSMVDTDILSHFLRGTPSVKTQAELYLQSQGSISFSIITYYEILNGLLYKDAHVQLERFDAFAALSKILPLTLSATRMAAQIASDLKKKGLPIGHTDCLIAGIAISNGLLLVTNNQSHFERIDRLQLSNWL